MRRLFLVMAKLVGLLQVYWAIANFMQFGYGISLMLQSEPDEIGRVISALVGVLLYLGLSVAMAWVLLVRTEWLADRLGIREEPGAGAPGYDVILRAGVSLIGLFVTVQAVPEVVRSVGESQALTAWRGGIQLWTRFVPAAVHLVLGLFLLSNAGRVVGWISRSSGRPE
jgi:hypothetical protein